MRRIEVAERGIGDDCQPFIVAEAGLNHNGNLARAMQMVSAAYQADCDAVKFGTFRADEFCAPDDPLYETFKACELKPEDWAEVKGFADTIGIMFFSTPQNPSDLEVLLRVGVPCVKIGSDDLTNTALIETYARARLPMILSTGMADERDVLTAVDAVGRNPLVVCVCTSEYPCPPEHANLARITTLREWLPTVPIGFSDHTVGPLAAAVAAALGASYFEKHFTLDNTLPGPDHAFSANPEQLANWVWSIRNALTLLGDGAVRPTEQETANRAKWRRASGQKIRGRDERHSAQVS